MHDRMILLEHDEAVLDAFDNRIGLGALMIKLGEARFVATELLLLEVFEALQDSSQRLWYRDVGLCLRRFSSTQIFQHRLDRSQRVATPAKEGGRGRDEYYDEERDVQAVGRNV